MSKEEIKFVYFGGEPLGVPVLEKLKSADLLPSCIVCSPDRPVGRSKTLTPPPVKVWAQKHDIPTWQPQDFKTEATVRARLAPLSADIFVVVAYNHILPDWLLHIPEFGAVNLHPSLLPALRGPSPIRSAILRDEPEHVGATVMLLDEKMDHGPILDQEPLFLDQNEWPMAGPELDRRLARLGGQLLADTLPAYLADDIIPQEQMHAAATYTKKFTKADAELQINPHQLPTGTAARQAWLAILAFAGIGDTYFMHNGVRIKINEAEFSGGKLRLISITPAGKSRMKFADWLQNN